MFLSTVALVALAANPYLTEGRRHFANLEFEAAAAALVVAIEQPGLTQDERREGFDLYAQSLLASGRTDAAEKAYTRLLVDDAYAPAPRAAPKVIECFTRAKRLAWPPPAVTLTHRLEPLVVTVFDPWSAVKRVRWFQALGEGLVEGAPPTLVERRFQLSAAANAHRVLIDALGTDDVLLAHLEVPLVPTAAERLVAPVGVAAPGPRWLTVTSVIVAAVAIAASITFFALAFRPAPALDSAASVNAWNAGTTRDAALSWVFAGAGVGATVTALFSATRADPP